MTIGNTWAKKVAYIAEEMYPNAVKITLLEDNLSSHKKHNLYNVFVPKRARAIIDRIEFVYTPKHGSWLNRAAFRIAECELCVLSRQALDKRFATRDELEKQVKDWANDRNNKQKGVDWQFSLKLKRLYPTLLT